MRLIFLLLCFILIVGAVTSAKGADTNTVSSTVVTDKSVPTANAPSVVVNNSDICKTAASTAVQTQVLGIASGITITDENCERIKLSRQLDSMGMKVAAISLLCQDPRVFEAMVQAGTPCPIDGRIGKEAMKLWEKYEFERPDYKAYVKRMKKRETVNPVIDTKPLPADTSTNKKVSWTKPK